MPSTPLSSALKKMKKESKLSIAKLAKAIGANVQSVTGVLKGKTIPNKITAPKYAKYLRLSLADFDNLIKPAPVATAPSVHAVLKRRGKRARRAAASRLVRPVAPVPAPPPPGTKPVTLAEAAELAADGLALSVHRASASHRGIIQTILKELRGV